MRASGWWVVWLLGSAGPLLGGCQRSLVRAEAPARDPAAEGVKQQVLRSLTPCRYDADSATPVSPPPASAPLVTSAALEGTPDIFVELAIFELPSARAAAQSSADVASIAGDPEARLLGARHAMVRAGDSAPMVLAEHSGPLAQAALRDVAIHASRSDSGELVLDLVLGLELPSKAAVGPPPRSEVRLHLAPRERQLVTLAADMAALPGKSVQVFAVPYVIRGQADLRELFMCKMRQRQRELANPRG